MDANKLAEATALAATIVDLERKNEYIAAARFGNPKNYRIMAVVSVQGMDGWSDRTRLHLTPEICGDIETMYNELLAEARLKFEKL